MKIYIVQMAYNPISDWTQKVDVQENSNQLFIIKKIQQLLKN